MSETRNKCARCEELEAELRRVKAELRQVKAELAALREQLSKLMKNSSNSSKPPSSDIINPPEKNKKTSGKRKRGGQPGHKRHQRKAFEANEIDRHWEYRLDDCPCCSGKLRDVPGDPARVLQQVELNARPITVEEHQVIGQWCPRCQKGFQSSLPEPLVKAGLVGPRLTSLVGWLHGVCHMSISGVRRYFRDVIGVRVSKGLIAKVVAKVSESLKDPYDAMLEQLCQEDVLNVDETGHKNNGKRMWTWCFRALGYTVFKVSPSRGSEVLLDVLGTEFNGLLGCDYFSAYRKYMKLNSNVRLQFCLAHLIRDIKYLRDHHLAANRRHGEALLELCRDLFRTIHQRDQYASPAVFRRKLESIRNSISWEATIEAPNTREARNLAERFYLHIGEYFRFITDPQVAATNNSAERAIRFIAIHRRLTQGTRGETGQRWLERIATVAVSCDDQARSAFDFIHEAITALFHHRASPTLLPAVNGASP